MGLQRRAMLAVLAIVIGLFIACDGGSEGMTVQMDPIASPTGEETPSVTGDGEPVVADETDDPTSTPDPEPAGEVEETQQPINEWGDLALTLVSIEPTAGDVSGNTQVVINGTAFKPSMIVLVGEVPVEDVFILDSTMAAFTTPPHPPGSVDLTVYIPHDLYGEEVEVETAVLESAFTYESEITVGQVIPYEGDIAGGELVTIVGEGFTEDARFFFDGREAIDTQRLDDYTLMGIAPPGDAGPAHIQVIANGHAFEATDAYSYRQTPEVTEMSPIAGAAVGGDLILITGAGLTGDPLEISLGDEAATIVDGDPVGHWVQVQSPAGEPGTVVDLSISTDWGTAQIEDAWSYADEEADPYLLSCSHMMPKTGPAAGGTLVTVACSGLQYGFDVSFGDTWADVVEEDKEAGFFVAQVPVGEPGLVDVTV
ncbi:MAG: IPT/TIG domain-containing protein, partial [Myxococcota bacterium]|nr:IPT/TIG domain-containing protein [Myxococcota bacterium]